jgi:hypothetical protein
VKIAHQEVRKGKESNGLPQDAGGSIIKISREIGIASANARVFQKRLDDGSPANLRLAVLFEAPFHLAVAFYPICGEILKGRIVEIEGTSHH